MRDIPSTVVPDSFELRGRAFSGLDALPRDEAQRLYSRAVRYGTACGCGAAAVGASLAGPLYLAGLPAGPTVAAALVGGVIGKGLGLWRAHRGFAAAGRVLQAAVDARQVHHG
jgi:hypothetical protein